MKNRPWLGLLATGPMSPALFRLHNLHVHLGPVASATLRVASRLANRLKAGTAVAPDQLAQAELILVSGPEDDFDHLLELALDPAIDWTGRTAIFLDFPQDPSDLAALRDRGASVGTLDCLHGFAEPRFIADTAEDANRLLQRFATATRSAIFFVTPGQKQFFTAGTAFTGSLFTPLAAATVECLKKAGLSQADAMLIAERNTLHTLRAFLKAGRSTGTFPGADAKTMDRQIDALRAESEHLSNYFASTARLQPLLTASATPIMETMDDSHAQRLAAAGRLAANLAHDWNNVLTLLAAQAGEIAAVLPPEHPARDMAAELTTSIEHAFDSPRRLLSWLREEEGVLVPADFNDAVRSALPLVELALGRGVRCVVELAAGLPQIPLDAPLLRNALLNLATNATSAMNGKGLFTIASTHSQNFIHLTVADTGHGMDTETRERIFEPFFSTRHSKGGTGLGLETVKSLAEAHHGTVNLDSAPGQGSRFIVSFPIPATTKAAVATPR